ncbi:MAG: glutathione S-transferase family protein [Burkholderiaceae bacterium]|nr:glutathione S-transferase family protein [Burkholderiaceae bacterium]
MITIHHHPDSTFARRVAMAMLEKNIPYEEVLVDMAARAHRSPAYLALNPYGRVPTLVEEGFVLYESTAILDYLEARFPAPALVPSDARGRALVAMHMKLCDLQMARQTGIIIFPKRFLPPARWNTDAMALAKAEIETHLAILEPQLAGHSYLVADAYSLADLCYTPFLQFLPLMEITPGPAVAAWSARLLERPSAVQTAPAR